MKRIFVIAGTEDGRELAVFLLSKGFDVTASVVSNYGRELLERHVGLKINARKLDAAELSTYLDTHAIEVVVDASHPYAANVSRNALEVCRAKKIPCIRYERKEVELTYEKIHRVANYEAAADCAARLGKNIFLTTGSRSLKTFVERLVDSNVIARVLPTSDVIADCERLGLTPKQIVAMQGPFSRELNVAMFRQFRAEVIVTKNSGSIGGVDEKIAAASELNLPIVMIDRPKIAFDNIAESFDGVLEFIAELG